VIPANHHPKRSNRRYTVNPSFKGGKKRRFKIQSITTQKPLGATVATAISSI